MDAFTWFLGGSGPAAEGGTEFDRVSGRAAVAACLAGWGEGGGMDRERSGLYGL